MCDFDSDDTLIDFSLSTKKRHIYDYQTQDNVKDKLENLVNNIEKHDVVFKVNEQYVYACKMILINGSDYFANMFNNNNFKESIEQKYIEIHDTDIKIFENIIRFITTGCININVNNITELCAAAKFYCLDKLVYECVNAIAYLDNNDLYKTLEKAYDKKLYHPYCIDNNDHIENIFIWRLVEYYLQNCKKNVKDEVWYKVPIEIAIIYMMIVPVSNEYKIFKYMIDYTNKNTNNEKDKIKMLHKLKYYVKLPYVTANEIHYYIRDHNIYSTEDIYEALVYSHNPKIFGDRKNEYKFVKRKIYL